MHKLTRLPKGEVKLEFEIPWDETRAAREEAVKELSTANPLPGFRPGHVTYEDAARNYGEMKILETALERIVRSAYVKAVLTDKIDTVGSPSVNIDKMTPGQPLVFSTISPITPEVTKMPDLAACKIDAKKKEANDAMVEEALDEMRKMRRVETPVDRAATLDDMVIVDMEMTKDKVALEGGNGNGYRVYLNEPNYIPGLADQLVGMKPGDEKMFTLPFPKEHFQKHLAGQNVDFKVKAAEVFELQLPKVDDEFAKIVGLENLAQLRAKLKENMQAEMDSRSSEAAEIEMLEKLTDAASFGEIPDLLINEEVRRMMLELETGLEDQGMDMPTYLQQIKKTKDELKLDFTQQAIRRIRTAVLIKNFAMQEKVTVSDDELDAETDRILASLKETDTETRERVISPDYREYMSIQMRNRKTLDWLKKQCIK